MRCTSVNINTAVNYTCIQSIIHQTLRYDMRWHVSRLNDSQMTAANTSNIISGRIQEFPKGPFSSPPLLSSPFQFHTVTSLPPSLLPSPPLLKNRAPLIQLGDLGALYAPQRGLGQSPGRKWIWCTLKLWESHWWQSFWVFWSACFTVERSKCTTN